MENRQANEIYWTWLELGNWRLHAAATGRGLAFVGSADGELEELAEWAKRKAPGAALVRDDERMRPYSAELEQYLNGERLAFTVPFDLRGTEFQAAVWNALSEIPYGETRSYADIANRVRRPSAVRAVGAAIGANPALITVPCHRVIGKSGSLTGYRGGLEMKRRLLELENGGAVLTGEMRRE